MARPRGWTCLAGTGIMLRSTKPDLPSKPSRIQFPMAWRLVLCLFGHLALLFFLAVYLVWSLNSVRFYTPAARAEEVQLDSVKAVPALLGAMDTQRRTYETTGDPRDLDLCHQVRA